MIFGQVYGGGGGGSRAREREMGVRDSVNRASEFVGLLKGNNLLSPLLGLSRGQNSRRVRGAVPDNKLFPMGCAHEWTVRGCRGWAE